MASHAKDDLPHKSINDAQLMLLFSEEAEKYTDAKVICKGIEWKVQQSILCTRCPYLEVCFRMGPFKEGETKSFRFDDDETYAVEALLIYLYTLEYPNRKSSKFEEPTPKAKKSTPAVPERKNTMNSARFRLKSEAPQELWQERLALYRMAHRLGIGQLCRTSLRVMAKEIEISLRSGSVTRFIRNVYDLDQEEAKSLKEEVATKIAEQEPCVVPRSELDLVLLTHPLFGCYLFKATQKKGESQTESIKTLQMVVDRQEKEIADYSQGVKFSEHKATATQYRAELDKQKAEISKQMADLDKLKAELKREKGKLVTRKAKENKDASELVKSQDALLKQQNETDKCKRKITQLEKKLQIPKKGKSARSQLSESESESDK